MDNNFQEEDTLHPPQNDHGDSQHVVSSIQNFLVSNEFSPLPPSAPHPNEQFTRIPTPQETPRELQVSSPAPVSEADSIPSTPNNNQDVSSANTPSTKSRSKTVVRKKRRGFFRTLGYEKLNIPITIICLIGTLSLAIAVAIKQAVRPTIMYCMAPNQMCNVPQDLWILDVVFLVVGGVIDIILLVLSVTIVMAPGIEFNFFFFILIY